MNPWELLAWVATVCAAVIIIVLTVAVVVAMVRSIRNPAGPKSMSRKVL